jgi:uracil phosphoribosyltransferase
MNRIIPRVLPQLARPLRRMSTRALRPKARMPALALVGAAGLCSVTYASSFSSITAQMTPAADNDQLPTRLDKLLSQVKALEEKLRLQQLSSEFQNVEVIDTPAVRYLFTVIRNKDTENPKYVRFADRLMTLLAEEGLARIGVNNVTIQTPCGDYDGLQGPDPADMCVVSIPRSGDILMEAVRRVSVGISVGKILCQRDESDPEKKAKLFYSKLPKDIASKKVVLVDPMLATGGSACLAIAQLVAAGVPAENIVFLNVVSCPEGLRRLEEEWPSVKVITAAIDPYLNEHKFIVPGLGDFGDRYYRTE